MQPLTGEEEKKIHMEKKVVRIIWILKSEVQNQHLEVTNLYIQHFCLRRSVVLNGSIVMKYLLSD